MKVALDATPLTLASGGIARYVTELSRALAHEFPDDQYLLVSDQPFEAPCVSSGKLAKGSGPRNWIEKRWWLCGVQREMGGADVFHGTHFTVPWLPLRPSVMTLHDLSPWLDPAWQAGAGFVRRRTPFLLGLGLATMIVTHTEAVRREAIEHFRLHPERVRAVPLAAGERFRPVTSPPSPPYFLYVGALEPRKNLDMLLKAWREAHRRHGVELRLAGRARSDFRAPAPEPGLRVLGEVPEEALPGLYSGAIACLYPSLYEGFGLPVLEAMQCGALVLASRVPAIAEVAGESALLLDPRDMGAWVEAMSSVVTHPEGHVALKKKALQRAGEYSWARTARLTHEVYEEAIRRFGA